LLGENYREVFIERVIDGDTIVTSEGEHVRLLGINTPERGEVFYEESKKFLENSVLNQTVTLEFTRERTDKYGRTLAYIFLRNENINIKTVEKGFANYYFYSGRDKYSEVLENAWMTCLDNKVNLCRQSNEPCSSCLILGENYVANNCNLICEVQDWTIKGEGRDKVLLNRTLAAGQSQSFELDLSNSGESLFLRDDVGGLVVYSAGE